MSLLLLPDARRQTGLYLLLFSAGSLLSILAARSLSGSRLPFLLLCATVFRATLLARPADLSDDLYRYLWDGRVARSGISPYDYPPSHPALDEIGIDPELRGRVAHAEIPTVYPPVAQAVFRIFSGEGTRGVALKTFFAAADVAIVALLWKPGPGGGFAAALYAFHPLPVTETAGQGHLDSLGVALLLASLAFLTRGRRGWAGLAYAASVLTKYVSAAALPVLLRRGRLRFLTAALLFSAAVWWAASRDASPLGGLSEFALRWDSNSLLYPGMVALMDAADLPERAKQLFIDWKAELGHPPWTQNVFPYFYSAFFARLALALVLLAALGWIAWRVRDEVDGTFASLAALLLLSPTLHPWYLLWILPFAAARRDPAFLYLSFAAPLAYALMYPVAGLSRSLVYGLEYVPFLLLLALRLRSALARGARAEARG